jgi:hypothetical protein
MSSRDAALYWVNQVRADLGRPPRTALERGYRSRGYNCPLARSIGGNCYIGLGWIGVGGKLQRYTRDLPPAVKTFIREFDQGGYPELELRSAVLSLV